MSWSAGLIVVIVLALVVSWLFGTIAERFNRPDEYDHVAERKRKLARRAKQQSREFQ